MTLRRPVPWSCSWRLLLLLTLHRCEKSDSLTSNAAPSASSTSSSSASNSRFVCLIQDYDRVQGPYFHALLDQMLENECQFGQRKLALCTTQKYDHREERMSQLEDDFDLDGCQLFLLDDYNPITLQEEVSNFDPTIFWLVDDNAFRIRYYLRTSGLDGILQLNCGGFSGKGCLYVGENAGALCAGASLTGAHKLQQDPKEAPEPQFFGLGLLGTKRSVTFIQSKTMDDGEESTMTGSGSESSSTISLDQDDVFIWSQPGTGSATSFVFLPCQRGAIANLEEPPNLPPLVEEDDLLMMGGVQCTGEPAIDPSRMMEQVGDSEWINEAEDLRQ